MVLSYLIEAARYVLHLFSSSVVHVPGVRLVVPQRKLGVRGSALEIREKVCSIKVSSIIFKATYLELDEFLIRRGEDGARLLSRLHTEISSQGSLGPKDAASVAPDLDGW